MIKVNVNWDVWLSVMFWIQTKSSAVMYNDLTVVYKDWQLNPFASRLTETLTLINPLCWQHSKNLTFDMSHL
jgi:hypothetical protein